MLRLCFQPCLLVVLHTALAFASVQKIGADLYAYISSNESSSNSVFLVGDSGVLVVDTGLNNEEGRKLLEEIRKVSPLPVRWIVNTHYHPDHRGGNLAVGSEAVVISTTFTRNRVLAAERRQPSSDYLLNQLAGPGELTLFIGGHPVRIYYPGPAHTRGDLAVYFPDQQALATGDLFLNGSCPYMDDGDLENWIAALDHMRTLPLEHVVPGHFDLAGKSQLQHFRDYLAALQSQVKNGWEQRLALPEVQRHLELDAYQDLRQFPKFEATFADNAAAYYHQLEQRGHPAGAK